MPPGQKKTKQKTEGILLTSSIKTLNIVHIKKIFKKIKKPVTKDQTFSDSIYAGLE